MVLKILNFTSVKKDGWRRECWEWAQNRVPFELQDAGGEHRDFCEILCKTYRGKFELSHAAKTAVFTFAQAD